MISNGVFPTSLTIPGKIIVKRMTVTKNDGHDNNDDKNDGISIKHKKRRNHTENSASAFVK